MKIKAKIERMVNGQKIKAIASASLDGQFVVRNLRVVDGNKGLFVAYPQETYSGAGGEKKYSNVFFPISNAGKADMEQAVLNAYRQQLDPSYKLSQSETRDQHYGNYQGYQGQPYDYPQSFEPLGEEDGILPFCM